MNAEIVYHLLSIKDRKEVASLCFQAGEFDRDTGEVQCICDDRRWKTPRQFWGHTLFYCEEEYLCEVLAAYMLMPEHDWNERLPRTIKEHRGRWVEVLAAFYEVELWSVRFRYALYMALDRPAQTAMGASES